MITFNLPAPPSANRIWKVGNNRIYKSSEYKAWLVNSAWTVREQLPVFPVKPLQGPFSLHITVRPQDKRLRDVDNYAKPVGDFLEASGLIENDRDIVLLTICRGEQASIHQVEVILQQLDSPA